MKKEILFEMPSPYRDSFRINAYRFGQEGEKSVAIVGAMRGDEIQQQYICAKLVSLLQTMERKGMIADGMGVLVIPSCNPFSMNVSRRFWAMDSTDINRMFPGYDQGETTQRIAAALFQHIKDYQYGIQMASFYMPGDFVPHVRMLQTGYEDTETARLFGMPYVTTRKPLPFDTTLLNYNWQVWGCKAYSIYAGQTSAVDDRTSQFTIDSVLRFLHRLGVITQQPPSAAYESIVFDEATLTNITATRAGIFDRQVGAWQQVVRGQTLARILDPYDATVREEITAPHDGTVFFAHNRPLALEHGIVYRIR